MAIFSLLTTFTATFAWFISQRNISDQTDDFEIIKVGTMIQEIRFYKYLGTSTEETIGEEKHKYYGFDPTPIGTLDVSNEAVQGTAPTISLGTFSLMDPHHPLLMIYTLNDNIGSIKARTEYSYLADDKVANPTETVADHDELEAVHVSNLDGGEVYEVTYDEDHGGVTTQYTYNKANREWVMNYVELKQTDNPLSSVIRTYAFTFDEIPAASNHDIYRYSNSTALPDNADTHEMRDSTPTATSCIALDVADFNDSEAKSFVDIQNNNYAGFEHEIDMFDNTGEESFSYVGIVIDYYSTSIEYISYHFLGHNYLTDGLQFKCDWATLI